MRCACKCNQKKGDTDKLFAPIIPDPRKNASGGARTRPLPCLCPLLAVRKCRSSHFAATAKKVCGICQKGLWQLPRKHRYPQMTRQKRPPHTADRRFSGHRKPLFAVCAARCCNIIIKRCGFFRVILLTLHETSNQPKKNTDYKWKALLHTRQARSGRKRRPGQSIV